MSQSRQKPLGPLQDKVVLVTGAGRGIGRAIALGFVNAGASVFAIARSTDELSTLKAEAGEDRIEFAVGDLADPKTPTVVVQQALDTFSDLDILIKTPESVLPEAPVQLRNSTIVSGTIHWQ
jgi:7-alpha-hydroxysteroid dehydrogenase